MVDKLYYIYQYKMESYKFRRGRFDLHFGAQLEQGSYATSYIPTNGSISTRQADTASGSGNSEVFNDSEGVLFADIQ